MGGNCAPLFTGNKLAVVSQAVTVGSDFPIAQPFPNLLVPYGLRWIPKTSCLNVSAAGDVDLTGQWYTRIALWVFWGGIFLTLYIDGDATPVDVAEE